MAKINVYSSSASNAIKVFDANSTGLKPDNAILVTTGTEPSNAIQINVGEKNWSSIAVNFGGEEPGPGPSLPPYTIRLKYKQGTTPTFSKGTGVLVDAEQNIWDLTYEDTDWHRLLNRHSNLIEVLGANTTDVTIMGGDNASDGGLFYGCKSLNSVALFDTSNVTNMNFMFGNDSNLTSVPKYDTSNVTTIGSMFTNCSSLTSVPLFNTSKVTTMNSMFSKCTSLTSVPLFDTSNVSSMNYAFNNCENLNNVPLFDTSNVKTMNFMFNNCYKVESGALSLYQQASTQTTPPTGHGKTFTNCGRDTETGAAELAQIPSDWGGTGT